jgi:aspartate/methionine/tyrosine aminotransferase
MRPRAVDAANATGILRAGLPEAAAFVWASIDADEDDLSEELAADHGITALPGRHFGAATPYLRIPFGGRPEAREALLGRLAAVARRAHEREPAG